MFSWLNTQELSFSQNHFHLSVCDKTRAYWVYWRRTLTGGLLGGDVLPLLFGRAGREAAGGAVAQLPVNVLSRGLFLKTMHSAATDSLPKAHSHKHSSELRPTNPTMAHPNKA